MKGDVAVIHERNIERDEKICSFHDVELRLPFASYQIAEFAMCLPTELKIEKKQDSLRKLVLRKTAENMGLSKGITAKPKKAVQYSTGISSALKKLAKKQNLTLAEYVNRLFLEAKNNLKKAIEENDTLTIQKYKTDQQKLQVEMTIRNQEFQDKYGDKINDQEFGKKFRKAMDKAMITCPHLSPQDRDKMEADLKN